MLRPLCFVLLALASGPGCVNPLAVAGRAPFAAPGAQVDMPDVLPGGSYASQSPLEALARPTSTTVGLNFNTAPASYQTATGRDVRGMARLAAPAEAEACAYGLFLPTGAIGAALGLPIPNLDLSFGDGGYQAAVAQLMGGAVDTIEDVRADLHVITILGIFGARCTVIHASAYGRASAPAVPPAPPPPAPPPAVPPPPPVR